MKATYGANKKKIAINNSYIPRWEYFKMLKFLDNETVVESVDETVDDINEIEYLLDDENEDENEREKGAGENCSNFEENNENDDIIGEIIGDRENGAGNNKNGDIDDRHNVASKNENRGKSWSYDEEETLINFNESYPELWDHKEPDYKKAKKSAILDNLCSQLNFKFLRKYSFYLFIHFD